MADNLNISPVKLSYELPPVAGKALIAGWGQMGWNLPATPNLMETTIDIWTNRKCAAVYGAMAPGGITGNMICGSAVGKDACRVRNTKNNGAFWRRKQDAPSSS